MKRAAVLRRDGRTERIKEAIGVMDEAERGDRERRGATGRKETAGPRSRQAIRARLVQDRTAADCY